MNISTVNKRVLKDIQEAQINLKKEFGIYIAPEETNYYNVHFVFPGPPDTPYFGGLYHGLIKLNSNHPLGPPNVHMITPSGRFTPESYPCTGRGICTSFTSYHPESWSPMITIETIMKGLISFMCDNKDTGVGSIQGVSDVQRKKLANESLYVVANDPQVIELMPELVVDIKNGSYVPHKYIADNPPPSNSTKIIETSKIKKESESNNKPKATKRAPEIKTFQKKTIAKKISSDTSSESETESETETESEPETETESESEPETESESESESERRIALKKKPSIKASVKRQIRKKIEISESTSESESESESERRRTSKNKSSIKAPVKRQMRKKIEISESTSESDSSEDSDRKKTVSKKPTASKKSAPIKVPSAKTDTKNKPQIKNKK